MRYLVSASLILLACAACTTTGSQSQLQATSEEPVASDSGEKQSLDKLLDEHDQVTLVDDDTGDTKLVCRRVEPPTGSRLGSRKVCATVKEWRDMRDQAQDELDKTQRNLDASCPTCG